MSSGSGRDPASKTKVERDGRKLRHGLWPPQAHAHAYTRVHMHPYTHEYIHIYRETERPEAAVDI